MANTTTDEDLNSDMKKQVTRFNIKTINDLPAKLSYLELTKSVLTAGSEVEDFAGFSSMLESFYAEVKKKLVHMITKEDV